MFCSHSIKWEPYRKACNGVEILGVATDHVVVRHCALYDKDEIGELSLGIPALLIIDVQFGMFGESAPVYNGEILLSRICSLIAQARSSSVPIFYIQHDGGVRSNLEHGAPEWEIHPSITPGQGDTVIEKRTPDSFFETDLDASLRNLGVNKLVVCGIQSDVCVDTTCRRAFSLGYDVTLVSDAHSTWPRGTLNAVDIITHHNDVLKWFADVKPASEISFETCTNPENDVVQIGHIHVTPSCTEEDRIWLRDFWLTEWGGETMVSKGEVHSIQDVEALIAWQGETRVGVATYHIGIGEAELISINATDAGLGVGSTLLQAVERVVRDAGAQRIWLITSNDNLDAIRFYQRREYRIVTVYPNAIDGARRLKPSIPLIGYYDIPIHDEWELEKFL